MQSAEAPLARKGGDCEAADLPWDLLPCGPVPAAGVSGCGFSFSPEELYSLPQLPAEYTELNNCLNQVIESGAEYAAPVSGSNIQPVQLEDLNGDGEEEAVAFFRNTADEKPLKIYILHARGGDLRAGRRHRGDRHQHLQHRL